MSSYIKTEEIWGLGGVSEQALEGLPPEDLDRAVTGASTTIDSYLRARFTLPITIVGEDIKRCAAIIAAYDIISGRGYNPTEGADENLRDRYEDCLKWLRDIAGGKVVPDIVDSGPDATPGATAAGSQPQVVSSSQRGWSQRGTNVTQRGPFQTD